SPVAKLSNRELEILALLGQGYTSEMIAQRLFLSRNTIGTYRERLKTKLNLKNYSELLFFAIHWADGSERKIVQQDATQAVQP
ncbi:MAG: response regulator transcription factor, partial [Pirellula staleyi]